MYQYLIRNCQAKKHTIGQLPFKHLAKKQLTNQLFLASRPENDWLVKDQSRTTVIFGHNPISYMGTQNKERGCQATNVIKLR